MMEISQSRDPGKIANLGLTLPEAKQLLARVQQAVVSVHAHEHAVLRPKRGKWGSSKRRVGRYRILFTAACAVAMLASELANPLRAQQAASDNSYGGSLLDRSALTGDWGGGRDDLAAQGITITPSLTQFYQGPTAGKTDRIFDYGDKAEVFVNLDGAKLGLWDGFAIQVHGEYNFGKTPGAVGGTTIPNYTAMTFPYQNQSGGDLTSVFFSQRFGSNFTLLAGKMDMFDFYASGHKFSGGRGIESFWNTAFVGPPSGIVPVAAFGAIGIYKTDLLTFTGMVYDPNDALNHTGLEHPFSDGVTFRGSVDLSSKLFGLPRTDTMMGAVSSRTGTDFASLPYLGRPNTPEFRAALIESLLDTALFGKPFSLPPRARSPGGTGSGTPSSRRSGRARRTQPRVGVCSARRRCPMATPTR
jgi:hypothetical protein